jgi:hypothetical protein
VVVIDEAQNLSDDSLEMVRLLTNFETRRAKLMQIVLSGQPKLSDKLMNPALEQLRQRISTYCRLEPLSAEETAAYIDHRLKRAGYEGAPLFTEDALKHITEASQGIPRTINNLCFNALSLCCALKGKQVDGSMAAEVIADQQLTPPPKETHAVPDEVATEQPSKPEPRKQVIGRARLWATAATVLLVASLLGALAFSNLASSWSHGTAEARSLDTKVHPSPLSTPSATSTGKAIGAEPTPKTAPFQITVEPDQRLRDIAIKYLGSFDLQRLHQIQALNSKLTDPNHIETGQKLWLPGPPAVPVANNEKSRASVRKLP